MAVRAYILIGTAVGTAGTVYKGLHKLSVTDAKVLSAETITGPFDVIALLEPEDLGRLGRAVTEGIQRIYGVERTTTCLIMGLA